MFSVPGDMCADTPQCGDYCNNELITAKKTPIREKLFYYLKIVSFCVFGTILVLVFVIVVSDGVHSHVHLVATPSEDTNDKEVLLEYISHLEAKQSIDKAEKAARKAERDGTGPNTPSRKRKKKSIIAKARSIMNRQYGKRRIALYAVHSGSNENKKYVIVSFVREL